MFDSIISWLYDKIGNLLNSFVIAACGVNDEDGFLALSIQNLINQFPAFATLYSVLQSIALGLLLLIGGTQIVRFFIGGAEKQETPTRTVIGGFIGAGLIFFGNYAVDAMIKLANLPYTAIWNTNLTDAKSSDSVNLLSIGLDIGGAGIVKTLFSFICIICIGRGLLKIILELFHHLFVVGVLTFTSPLAYCTVVSGATMQTFKKWLNMLVSQLIIMSLTAWGLKLILASLEDCSTVGGFLFLLAACNIVQRMDSYVQQLGLNTAVSGASMAEDAMGAMRMMKGVISPNSSQSGESGGRSNTPPLGANFSPTGRATGKAGMLSYGILGAGINAVKQGAAARAAGATVSQSFDAAKKGIVPGAIGNLAPGVAAVAAGTVAGIAGGIKDGVAAHKEGAKLKDSLSAAKEGADSGFIKTASKVKNNKFTGDPLQTPANAPVMGGSKQVGTVRAVSATNALRTAGKARQSEAKAAESSLLHSNTGPNAIGMSPETLRTAFGEAVIPASTTYTDENGLEHSLQYSAVSHSVDKETLGNKFDYQVRDTYTDENGQEHTTVNSYSLMDSSYLSTENGYDKAMNAPHRESFKSLSDMSYTLQHNGKFNEDYDMLEGGAPINKSKNNYKMEKDFYHVPDETYRASDPES